MRYYLIIILLFISCFVKGQQPCLPSSNYGNTWNRGTFSLGLGIPVYASVPSVGTLSCNGVTNGLVYINSSNNTFYYYSNGAWYTGSGGGSGVTSVSGTTNQINSTGGTTPVLSLYTNGILPGTWNLGTPSALVGTNETGLPLTTGVIGILPIANGGTNSSVQTSINTTPITYGSNNTISATPIGSMNVTAGNGITVSGNTSQSLSGTPSYSVAITNTTVTPGTYGSSTSIPGYTVNAQGQITGVTSYSITSGGSGTVTSVSSGNLSPVFTSSVTTSTTTPVISYSLTPISANTILGGTSSGAPSYFSPILASSLFNNQGTNTTLLHGNASGNPSWGQVVTGDIANNAVTYAKLQPASTNEVLLGSGNTTAYQEIQIGTGLTYNTMTQAINVAPVSLVTSVTGILPTANGGLNKSTTTQYAIPYATSSTVYGEIPIGSANQMLEVNTGGTGYVWVNPASGTVTSITAGTGLSGGTITTSGTISMPSVGTSGTYGSSTTIPEITTDAQGRVTSVTTVNIAPAAQTLTVNTTPMTTGNAYTITASANTLTTTTLNPTVVTSSLTSVGTIGTGTWQGTKLDIGYGGTNATTATSVNATPITYGSNNTITAAPSGTAGGDLTGSYPNPTIVTVNASPATYTYSTVTVDSKGRVTSASSGTAPTTYTSTYPINISGGVISITSPDSSVAYVASLTPYSAVANRVIPISYEINAASGAITVNNPAGSWQNNQALFITYQDNGTARAITYGTKFKPGVSPTALTPAATTVIGQVITQQWIYNANNSEFFAVGQLYTTY